MVRTVGFDHDLTLVDSRPGVSATCAALSAETGVAIDGAAVIARLGPPLEVELANWFATADVPAAAARYRELYAEIAIARNAAMTGAREAVAAVRAGGDRVVVLTAAMRELATANLARQQIEVDDIRGWLWGPQKAAALRELGAVAYVGDHVADVEAAKSVGVLAVGVASGPCSPEELAEAGADVVLGDLAAFPEWWKIQS